MKFGGGFVRARVLGDGTALSKYAMFTIHTVSHSYLAIIDNVLLVRGGGHLDDHQQLLDADGEGDLRHDLLQLCSLHRSLRFVENCREGKGSSAILSMA